VTTPTAESALPTVVLRLESTFRHIQQTRMTDVPVLNPNLRVRAIGFRTWQSYWLGVLVTPWFMNLLLLPEEAGENPVRTGSVKRIAFPSGCYDFIAGFEEAIGYFYSCSLFSPMFEFDGQQAAEQTAEAVLKVIMDETCQDIASQTRAGEIREIWQGGQPGPDDVAGADNGREGGVSAQRPAKPLTRRDFLRGRISAPETTGRDETERQPEDGRKSPGDRRS